jgi:hypothetical protein
VTIEGCFDNIRQHEGYGRRRGNSWRGEGMGDSWRGHGSSWFLGGRSLLCTVMLALPSTSILIALTTSTAYF